MQWRMLTPTSAEAKPTEQDAGSTADYPEPPEGSQGEALEVQGQGHAQGIGLGHLCPPQAAGDAIGLSEYRRPTQTTYPKRLHVLAWQP